MHFIVPLEYSQKFLVNGQESNEYKLFFTLNY